MRNLSIRVSHALDVIPVRSIIREDTAPVDADDLTIRFNKIFIDPYYKL